ncbi:aminoglycoside N3'-acetyltransferase [Halovivax asiaticus JCM 14624]|uniref:Aminoglycoside N3'-acetyltransferase n=1 Tax=Halovivax asiaticus JCM 14624 TaxID=1227490 RepID=M0BE19_9EURY|nr:AAC(3) family N-acetyltransferase [Halovivax asiaticus]ELZ09136.1 aminoglycoside N3'-acetyltransferase [Halovivax asiaticus JCM 14624]
MNETLPEDRSPEPITVESMAADLRELGVQAGQTILVHGSLSKLGWVCGGPQAVVDALQRVVGADGTIVMPTHSPGNMNPADMGNPPVPESWYDTVRETMPPYRPESTPTQGMGAIAECFRNYPGVVRSDHPQHSFAAWGADAEYVTDGHSLKRSLGENSPLARVYELDGDVCFLGTTHATNTSLHLAEYRADLDLGTAPQQSAILVDGEREWVEWDDIDFTDEDFPECGDAFEREHPEAFESGTVGVGDAKLLSQPTLVDFAVEWFEANR